MKFVRKNNFLHLFINVWVETHFPLERPAAYFFQVIVYVDSRLIYIMHNWKVRSVISNEFMISAYIVGQAVNINKLRKEVVQGSTFEKPLKKYRIT